MSIRSRFNIISILGLLFLALVIHDLVNTRLRIILDRESFGYLLGLLPVNPVVVALAAILALAAIVAIVVFVNRRLAAKSRRRGPTEKRLFTIPLGAAFLLAGLVLLWKYPRYPFPQEWSGAGAAVVGLSLLLFMFVTAKRTLAFALVGVLVLVVAAMALPRILPGHRDKVETLRRLMETASDDLGRRQQSWTVLNPEEVVADARLRAGENGVYRFDEHLDDITKLDAPEMDEDGGVLFELPKDGKFMATGPAGAEFEVVEGKQIFPDYRGGSYLRTEKPLSLPWADIGSFQITMKVSGGQYFQVYWGEKEGDERHGIRIPLGPPGESASYEIREKIIRYRGEDEVKHLWIVPSDQDARVEIESFRIVDRTHAVLRGAPFGVGYENVDEEIRRVLFVPTPFGMSFTVSVPRRAPRVLFGITTLDESIPTTFQVSVGYGGSTRSVFSKAIAGDSRWRDFELDLAHWAGKTVDVSFKTSAPERNLALWSNPVLVGEPAPQPNIVFYLVDCLRADHLGAYGYSRNTSPVFDSLATTGTLFERAYSNGTTTKLSVPSLFTSNPISATGVRHNPDVLPEAFPTLAEILRSMGYATAAFTTNGNAGPFSGTHQGFSRLFTRNRIAREGGGENDMVSADAEVLIGDLMRGWIDANASRNFFLYVHTMDAHGQYDPPPRYRHYFETLTTRTPVKRNNTYDPSWVETPTREGRTALYDGEIEYGDEYLGRFIDMLDEAGVLENTIIFFLADHGEYFGEHGLYGHKPPPFVQGTNIPLLIAGPGFPAGVRVKETVQIMDVMPTVLDALGLAPDPVLFQGESLTALANGDPPTTFVDRTVFIEAGHPGELAFHSGDYHVLPEKNLIFDLTRDPKETVYFNEFIFDFGVKASARKLAAEYLRTYAALHKVVSPAGGDVLDVDPETLKQLRSLGYIK